MGIVSTVDLRLVLGEELKEADIDRLFFGCPAIHLRNLLCSKCVCVCKSNSSIVNTKVVQVYQIMYIKSNLPNERNHEKEVIGVFECQLGGDILSVHW